MEPAGHDAVRATHRVRSKAPGRRRRRVAQEPRHAVKEIPSLEEAAEHLDVLGVDPFTARLDRVPAVHDREVVFHLESLGELVHVWREEKRVAETK